MADQLEYAVDLMRRLPPQNTEDNLAALIDLAPHLAEDLLQSVDQPLRVERCRKTGREYLRCDYNRDGDSYRSPWSNEYEPELLDGSLPSTSLRRLEVAANDAFDTYRKMYYEGGVSSVYFWDLDDGFAGVVLIKKVNEDQDKPKGAWDSIHVFEAIERGRNALYKLTSTVMLYAITESEALGSMNLSGSMTRQTEIEYPLDEPGSHVGNIGRMVEEMELKMRSALQEVYFGKTRDVVNDLRSIDSLEQTRKQADMQRELIGKLQELQPSDES
ncbi:F-actin-capping protein subunit beta [Thamnocephalis sphaerospora]|uniref:F-actin-capping protein subunit beta n=1 Tax=Thamnocephalis sphaerospora TaxID=78915 RepID=A0A4P9XTA7_9FUNG|nr:F-actin-capping protein subunit beta [Thamnocephalis sphaerospora]|eukprot:RKP09383.1 F-actin-capping protein subunit beta [Thamnocephalis sphaerospora]